MAHYTNTRSYQEYEALASVPSHWKPYKVNRRNEVTNMRGGELLCRFAIAIGHRGKAFFCSRKFSSYEALKMHVQRHKSNGQHVTVPPKPESRGVDYYAKIRAFYDKLMRHREEIIMVRPRRSRNIRPRPPTRRRFPTDEAALNSPFHRWPAPYRIQPNHREHLLRYMQEPPGMRELRDSREIIEISDDEEDKDEDVKNEDTKHEESLSSNSGF